MRAHRLVFLLFSSSLVLAWPQASDRNPDLALGIQAYQNAKYEEAARYLERAVAVEPENVQAHHFLAKTYAQEYIPGSSEVLNLQNGNAAIREYKKVLELEPTNLDATKSLALVFFNTKELEQAIEVNRKAIEINPKDPEPYYSIAVVEWTQTYQPRMEQRAKLKLRVEQPLIFAAECWTVRQANWERVADGIEMLKKAIDLRRDYDDAMAYMNLMYRERADLQCDDPRAQALDLKAADEWVDMTLAIKKRKAESQRGAKLKSGQETRLSVE